MFSCTLNTGTKFVKYVGKQKSIDSKSILKQSESEEVTNIQVATGSNTIQVSSAILQDQVTCFIINFTNFKLTFI